MLKKDILLIINPNASKGRGRKKAKQIQALFRGLGRECTVAYTRAPGHAESLARRGASYGYDTIVAAGGDGTVNETVNGILKSGAKNVRMGVIPIGRGNDFAWMAGIPGNQKKAVRLIASGNAKRIDAGLCKDTEHPDGMYFVNGAGFGFEPMVNFKAMEYKHINGMLSYAIAFLSILAHPPKPYSVMLTIDGESRRLETQQISVSNGRRMGSAFIMAPLAEIDDSYFDVMYTTHGFERKGLLKAVLAFFRGAQISDKNDFAYIKAREVIIKADEAVVEAHCDGELFSHHGRSITITICPGALELFCGTSPSVKKPSMRQENFQK